MSAAAFVHVQVSHFLFFFQFGIGLDSAGLYHLKLMYYLIIFLDELQYLLTTHNFLAYLVIGYLDKDILTQIDGNV